MDNTNDTSNGEGNVSTDEAAFAFFGTAEQFNEELAKKVRDSCQKQYDKFHVGLQNPEAKKIVENTFRLVNTPEWPLPYFQMRDIIWIKVFGFDGANFLVNYLVNGEPKPPFNIKIDEQDSLILEQWFISYKGIARRAENFSKNPMGFDDFYTIYQGNPPSYMIRPFRNDGENVKILVTPESVEFMIHRLLEILPEVEQTYNRKVDRAKLIDHFDKVK